MADVFGILGQLSPSATILTLIYTCPLGKFATVSSVCICNTTSAKIKFRLSAAKAAEADNIKQYLLYDVEVAPKSTFTYTIGISLAGSDVLRVYATTINVAFNVFGVEVS